MNTTASGRKSPDGGLHLLAHKPVSEITADDIRNGYATVERRSPNNAMYAMRVRPRPSAGMASSSLITLYLEILLAAAASSSQRGGNPSPVPPESLGAWWRAALGAPSAVASDYYRFQFADRLSRRRDSRRQAMRLCAHRRRRCRSSGWPDRSSRHEEPHGQQAAALQAGNGRRGTQLREQET